MKLVCFIVVAYLTHSQQSVFFIRNSTSNETMYHNSTYNQQFILHDEKFVCTRQPIYTYKQSPIQHQQHAPYYIQINGANSSIAISINTLIPFIDPSYSLKNTSNNSTFYLQIRNGCPQYVSYFDNFDMVYLSIGNLKTFVYNVVCDSSRPTNTLEWGLFIVVGISIIIIGFTAKFENAGSFKNFGFQISYLFILFFSSFIIAVIILVAEDLIVEVINWVIKVIVWIVGTIGIGVCFIEIFYATKISCLRFYCKICNLRIRIMDMIGFVFGFGLCFVWYFSDKNYIISDLIFICIWISGIKILKFTNLKVITFALVVLIIKSAIIIVVLELIFNLSYDSYLLNQFNSPLFFQVPTISFIPNQKCSWIFMSSLIFPGMFASYLLRFDKSRSSKVYFVMFMVGYAIGSIVWVILNLATPFILPFGIITEPVLLIVIVLFSNRRNELQILWSGQFLDEEYRDSQIKREQVIQIVKLEKNKSRLTFRESLLRGLRLRTDLSEIVNQ